MNYFKMIFLLLFLKERLDMSEMCIEMIFDSDFVCLLMVGGVVCKFCDYVGMDEMVVYNIEFCVVECVMNLI